MTINIVCVGNLKEKFSKDAEKEYLKRLSAFCKVKITELKEQNQLQSVPATLKKEGEEILQHLDGFCVLCDIGGEQLSSETFAKKLSDFMLKTSQITFVIGGSYGVSEEVQKRCSMRFSFSSMTFPHNLFRIMLLEQIYRAFMIMSGKSYHK